MPPRQRGAVGLGVDALELAAERGDQQVHLRREVAVQRADGDIGAFGDGAHLNGLVAALGRDRQGGVEDALAAFALRFGAELGLGEYGHVHHLTRSRSPTPDAGLVLVPAATIRHAAGSSFILRTR